jgi:hypothetical protein
MHWTIPQQLPVVLSNSLVALKCCGLQPDGRIYVALTRLKMPSKVAHASTLPGVAFVDVKKFFNNDHRHE